MSEKKTMDEKTTDQRKKPAKKVAKPKEIALNPKDNALDMVKLICNRLDEKKAQNIIFIDIAKRTTIADYFVIASASSARACAALSEQVEEMLSKEYEIEPLRVEGRADSRWIAMDYGIVIVHIFIDEVREAYQLEKLWTEGADFIELNK